MDVSSLTALAVVSQTPLPGNANDVRVGGTVAYVAAGNALLTLGVTDPGHPARLGSVAIAGNAVRLAVAGTLVYVADLAFGLHVIDASNPLAPSEIAAVALPGEPRAVGLGGPGAGGSPAMAVVACGDAGLAVLDVSNPAAPALVGQTPPGLEATSVTVRGHYAYVPAGDATGFNGGLHVVELADPANPVEVGASADDLGVTRAALDGGFALAAQFFAADQVAIFDIGGLPPLYTAVLDLSALGGVPRGSDIAVVPGTGAVFVTANASLGDFGFFGTWLPGQASSAGLYTAVYRLPPDAGTAPPSVSFTAPAAGTTVRERLPVTVTATASDEVAVTSVAFAVNGTPVDTIYKPPYQSTFPVPAGQPTATVTATATSIGGAQATAQLVLGVQPYPLPVVTLVVPTAGQTVVGVQSLVTAAEASDAIAVTRVELSVNGQLFATLNQPPYVSSIVAPVPTAGSGTLAVSALAYDAAGAGQPPGPVTVTVNPDVPPVVELFSSADGSQVVEGAVVPIVAGASDASGIANVQLFLNGAPAYSTMFAPYTLGVPAPPAGQSTLIHVTATDGEGLQSSTPDVTVVSISDPGTTLIGRVVDPTGAAVAGATVSVTAQGGASGGTTSAADGSFSVPGLPSNQGDLGVGAGATLGGCPAQASASVTPPATGGTADAGNLMLVSSTVAPSTTVTGTVLGTDGQGLGGVTVTVSSVDLASAATATTGAGGIFAIAGFQDRRWQLRAEAVIAVGGVMLYGTSGNAAPLAGGTTDLGTWQLQPYPFSGPDPLTTLSGQVVNDDGSAAGALVVVDLGYAQLTTTTAADGSWSVGGVPTLAGSVYVGASLVESCALYFSGGATLVEPLVPGGVTSAGALTLRPDSGPVQD